LLASNKAPEIEKLPLDDQDCTTSLHSVQEAMIGMLEGVKQ